MNAPKFDASDNAGTWAHIDGTPCPHYWASRPTAESGLLWWCTEHQQNVRVVDVVTP